MHPFRILCVSFSLTNIRRLRYRSNTVGWPSVLIETRCF